MLAPIASPQFVEEPLRRKRFAREEVNQMLDLGLFSGQRFELIDGDLIDKMGQNPAHASAIRFLSGWASTHFPGRFQCQLPIELAGPDAAWNEPEPDITVFAEAKAAYQRRHPRSDETILVIEVADSTVIELADGTLRQDSERKRSLYARGGVPEYWVADLRGRRLIVHRNPIGDNFTDVKIFTEGEIVAPLANPLAEITVGAW